jgi:hypothetical protein
MSMENKITRQESSLQIIDTLFMIMLYMLSIEVVGMSSYKYYYNANTCATFEGKLLHLK